MSVLSIATSLQTQYHEVRRHTLKLVAPLSAEDSCVQSMPMASPAKWHLAHTSWFFETFVLERFEPNFKPWNSNYRVLFNSYYEGIGEQYPRPKRGLITRPSLDDVKAYRGNIDERIDTALENKSLLNDKAADQLIFLITLGLNHEQQHQELILSDIQHLFWQNPLLPAYHKQPDTTSSNDTPVKPLEWLNYEETLAHIGYSGDGFHFDNEQPQHRSFLESFQLANRLVSNGEYQKFIDDGAYQNPALWLSEGWHWLHSRPQAIDKPLYWKKTNEKGWCTFDLSGLEALNPNAPVRHISYYEADAYARWAGARLPTEAEWEYAAKQALEKSQQADAQPSLVQLFDQAWQWTSSSYAPYPGFKPADGAIGEYNGKFMVNQYVLRGGSSITPKGHSRPSYRNFFPADTRWQYTGIRLARSQ